MALHDFSACIVTYRSDPALLQRAIASLAQAVAAAREAKRLGHAQLFVVDNGPGDDLEAVRHALRAWPEAAGPVELLAGHGNVGYGRANNRVLERLSSGVHLV